MRVEPSSSGATASRPDAVPLFQAAWLFAVGISVTHWLWLRPGLLLAALAILCGIAAVKTQRILLVPLAALWCLLGAWCGLMEPHPAPAADIASLSDGLARTLEDTVIDTSPVRNEVEQNLNDDEAREAAVPAEPTQRIDVQLGSLEKVTDTEDKQETLTGQVRLTVRWPAGTTTEMAGQTFHCGDRIQADARLLQPAVYHDPGVWSRADYLLDQGITSTGIASRWPNTMRKLGCSFVAG
jgi:competence protein ComEC